VAESVSAGESFSKLSEKGLFRLTVILFARLWWFYSRRRISGATEGKHLIIMLFFCLTVGSLRLFW
jgi:hypothetical protein